MSNAQARSTAKKHEVEIHFPVIIKGAEDVAGYWEAECTQLHIATCGDERLNPISMIRDAISQTIEYDCEQGNLEKTLRENAWNPERAPQDGETTVAVPLQLTNQEAEAFRKCYA